MHPAELPMAQLVLAARLLLGAAFLTAGMAKAFDRKGSRDATVAIGLPPWLAMAVSWMLPAIEVGVAWALFDRRHAWSAAIFSLGLLLAFVAFTALSLQRKITQRCGCFGHLSTGTPATVSIIRNELLLAIAGFIAWYGRQDIGVDALVYLRTLSPLLKVGLAGALAAIVLLPEAIRALLHLVVWRRRRARGSAHTPDAHGFGASRPTSAAFAPIDLLQGSPAPPLNASHDIRGLPLDDRRMRVLVFSRADSAPCDALLAKLRQWSVTSGRDLAFVVADAPENLNAYGIAAVPSAVAIRPDGRIASRVAIGEFAIQELVQRLALGGVDDSIITTQRDRRPPSAQPCPCSSAQVA